MNFHEPHVFTIIHTQNDFLITASMLSDSTTDLSYKPGTGLFVLFCLKYYAIPITTLHPQFKICSQVVNIMPESHT